MADDCIQVQTCGRPAVAMLFQSVKFVASSHTDVDVRCLTILTLQTSVAVPKRFYLEKRVRRKCWNVRSPSVEKVLSLDMRYGGVDFCAGHPCAQC